MWTSTSISVTVTTTVIQHVCITEIAETFANNHADQSAKYYYEMH